MPEPDGWWGCDLDGCLAEHHPGQSIDTIGAPVPRMVARVKAWLAVGREVRIFTARVAATGDWVECSQRYDDAAFAAEQRPLIEAWCELHLGVRLPVTAVKDYRCAQIYDDRAWHVFRNTGRVEGEHVK